MFGNGFIMTTSSSVEGYRIVEQCGIVFGETVFRHGFSAKFGAGLKNLGDSLTWDSREMSGSMRLIENAREYAYSKMKDQAQRRGANAIIAIDSDNTFGGDIMYISLYGTAVKIIPEKEYEKQKKIEDDEQERKKAEAKHEEDTYIMRLNETGARKAGGDLDKEIQFLRKMNGLYSAKEIWALWVESGLGDEYREINDIIRQHKDIERVYGNTPRNTEKIKKEIRDKISEM